MAGSINKVILIGNLGKDPEVRHLENGAAVANLPIATSETYKDRKTGEKVTQTEWHTIVLWRGLADIAEKYLHKGDKIDYFPYNIDNMVQSVYIYFDGWNTDLTELTEADTLPLELKNYINFLGKELETPISIVSVGPDRKQIMTLNDF